MSAAELPAAPPSYATADEARAYVARVLGSGRAPRRPPVVYLIAWPKLRQNAERWGKILPALQANVRGAELVDYRAALGKQQRKLDERVPMIADRCDGALVVPYASRWPGLPVRYLIGYPARQEAEQLAALGLPVLVFSPLGLVAWPDVLVRPALEPRPPAHLSQELLMPALAGAGLPTVAASFRALGLEVNAKRKPRGAPAPVKFRPHAR